MIQSSSDNYFIVITNTISRFFNSFDLKDWDVLKETLFNQIDYDYRDIRGKAGTCTNDEYVSERKMALQHLKTQHLYTNIETHHQDESKIEIQLNSIIFRKNNDGQHFNSHVIYFFTLLKIDAGQWKIKKIKQQVLWHDGDPSIHQGFDNKDNDLGDSYV